MQLWHAYLRERRAAIRGLPLNHTAVEGLNNTYERALVSMHKMPRVWVEYLELLMSQQKLTHTRHVFDRCLCSLPITQHDRIWTLYLVSRAACDDIADAVNTTIACYLSRLNASWAPPCGVQAELMPSACITHELHNHTAVFRFKFCMSKYTFPYTLPW